jgi:ISXO2-like transposase domain
MKHFRDLVATTLEEVDQTIGGDGVVVEVDETKLGKRKYNRGHRVDGVWVMAGVEKTAQKKVFLVEVQDRSAETLLEIIRTHVLPGSIVHTDMFRGGMLESQQGLDWCTEQLTIRSILLIQRLV